MEAGIEGNGRNQENMDVESTSRSSLGEEDPSALEESHPDNTGPEDNAVTGVDKSGELDGQDSTEGIEEMETANRSLEDISSDSMDDAVESVSQSSLPESTAKSSGKEAEVDEMEEESVPGIMGTEDSFDSLPDFIPERQIDEQAEEGSVSQEENEMNVEVNLDEAERSLDANEGHTVTLETVEQTDLTVDESDQEAVLRENESHVEDIEKGDHQSISISNVEGIVEDGVVEDQAETSNDKDNKDAEIERSTDVLKISETVLESDEDDDANRPMIRVKQVGLFADEDDEDDEDDKQDGNSHGSTDIGNSTRGLLSEDVSTEDRSQGSDATQRPRRAAATAAASVIREMTREGVVESEDLSNQFSRNDAVQPSSTEKQRCFMCKTIAVPTAQFKKDNQSLYFCSNNCFNTFRNPDGVRKTLPCAKCGIVKRDVNMKSTYYWETMNFCSELCVGNFQVEIGSKCATCSKKVAWSSLGKYCVRFGSDVRQFCTASCLEQYKKDARICFHCQLDIKKLSNVILANIPAKTSPKEFCSQDCVEMYIEQNLNQGVRHKPAQTAPCVVCILTKEVHREMILNGASWKVCSQNCWTKFLDSKALRRPYKCELCPKYLSMDAGVLSSASYVITPKKLHGFCTPTCKNVFVLKSRQILACTTCKVKKYNYDLIEHIVDGSKCMFSVCSLNCIPKPSQYILNLRETLTPPSSASEMLSKSRYLQELQPLKTLGEKAVNSSGSRTKDSSSNGTLVNGNIIREFDSQNILLENGGLIRIHEGEPPTINISEEEMKSLLDTVESLLVAPPPEPKEKRNKGCSVRPSTFSVGCQADIPLEGEPPRKIQYVPLFIPYYVPFPFYGLETPVPVPMPVPLPVPIPIPVIIPTDGNSQKSYSGESVNNTTPAISNAPQQPLMSMQVNPAIVPPNPMSGNLSLDTVGFLEMSEPIVGESDSFNILNTIPNLEMDLNLGSAHMQPAMNPNIGAAHVMPPNALPIQSSCAMGMVNPPVSGMHWQAPAIDHHIPKLQAPIQTDMGTIQYALNIWRENFGPEADPFRLPKNMFVEKLVELVVGNKQTGARVPPHLLLHVALGLQHYLRNNNKSDRVFYDPMYEPFVLAFTNAVEVSYSQGIVNPLIDESLFWRALELGVSSPEVLLFTLVYYNYKYFNLRTWQEHESLQLNQFVITTNTHHDGRHYKSLSLIGYSGTTNNVEILETEPTDRCFVKLFEFYKFKSSTDVGPFYKAVIPHGTYKQHWYSADTLSKVDIYRLLIRAMMLKS